MKSKYIVGETVKIKNKEVKILEISIEDGKIDYLCKTLDGTYLPGNEDAKNDIGWVFEISLDK